MAKQSGWEAPYAILAGLLFLLMLAVALLLANAASEKLSDFGDNLISELIGFVLTAGVVGWFSSRQARDARRARSASRRAAVFRQVQVADARLKAVLVGRSAFGAQYVPRLRHALSALERLDFDCAELAAEEQEESESHDVDALQQLTRDLLGGLESLQNDLMTRPPSAMSAPLPTAIVDLAAKWRATAGLEG